MFNRFRQRKAPAEPDQSPAVPTTATPEAAHDAGADAALTERLAAFLSGSTRPGSAHPGRVAQVTAALATPPGWDNSGTLAAFSASATAREREAPVGQVTAQPAPPPEAPPEAYDLGQGGAAWQG